MTSLTVLSGKEVVRVFERFGWKVVRQSSSHIILTKDGEVATLSVPDHKEVISAKEFEGPTGASPVNVDGAKVIAQVPSGIDWGRD